MSPEQQPEDTQGKPADEGEGAEAESPAEASSADASDDSSGMSDAEEMAAVIAEEAAAKAAEEAAAKAAAENAAAEAIAAEAAASAAASAAPPSDPGPDIRPVQFSQVEDETEAGEGASLELLMDIRLPVSVELGRTQSFVRDILEYGPGSIIELDKLAGDPVDLYVNGKMVAQGEVVVIDEHFGVRVTSLLSPQDRVRSLGE